MRSSIAGSTHLLAAKSTLKSSSSWTGWSLRSDSRFGRPLYSLGTDGSSQVETMDAHALRCFAKGLQTLDPEPTRSELKRIDEVLTLYVRRAVGLMDQLVARS